MLSCGTPLEIEFSQNTPEMNELEPNKKSLKIWTHNFEKQKSWSILGFWFFDKKTKIGALGELAL